MQPTIQPRRQGMPLRALLAFTYLLAVLLIGGGAYLAISRLVARGFGQVERGSMVAQLERAQATLGLRAETLYGTVGDWATWNETYNYVRTLSPYYVQQNLYQGSLATLGVSFMLYLDDSGKQVAYLGFDLHSGEPDPRWQAVPTHIPGHLGAPGQGKGFVRIGNAVALVAYRPILRNDGSGPPRGTLVMGRVLDAGVAADLSTVLRAKVSLSPASVPASPRVRTDGPDTLTGTTVVTGLDGRPAAIVRITQPRPVAAVARLTRKALLAALACLALAGGLAAALVLELQVSGPLTRLTREVARIADEADADDTPRVTPARGRELGRLAAGVNVLLERLGRRRAELLTRERRFRRLFIDSPIGSAIVSDRGRVLQCNPAFERISGYSAEELRQPGAVLALAGGGDGEQERQAIASLASGQVQRYQWERRLVRKDGTPMYALLQMSRLGHDPESEDTFIVQVLDFTARREREQEALTLAFQDPLTGLANRRVLHHRLAGSIEAGTAEPGALLYLDLDRFKPINDRYGHEAGDRVLSEISRRMTAQLRRHDLLARLGGDEFAVFLPGAGEDEARRIADRLTAAVTGPIDVGSGAWAQLAVSVGIALGPARGESPEGWLHRADDAMYRAKRSGGSRAEIAAGPAEVRLGRA